MTIDHIGEALSKTNEQDRPSKVVFVIITDGMENASEKYFHTIVKNMISHQQSKYSWEFVFLGANFDAEAFAESISINRNNAVRYENSSAGVKMNYQAVDDLVMCLRKNVSKKVNKDWKKKIKKEDK